MAVTAATFRVAFPEFVSVTNYPDGEVEWWIALAAKLQDVNRWGNLYDDGIMLFVAHNLALQRQAVIASTGGQVPGMVQGAITSASVDKVSYSRDAASVMLPGAGHWNLTTYGLRYKWLINMVGAGPVQVGAPPGGLSCNYYGGAWPGPMQGPY